MAARSPRPRVSGSALTTPHFLLLFAAMLVAAAGNTALQSVMPAIGRAIGIADLWVAIAYTSSAILWVMLAPYWARMSDRRGRKALTLLGVLAYGVGVAVSLPVARTEPEPLKLRLLVGALHIAQPFVRTWGRMRGPRRPQLEPRRLP